MECAPEWAMRRDPNDCDPTEWDKEDLEALLVNQAILELKKLHPKDIN